MTGKTRAWILYRRLSAIGPDVLDAHHLDQEQHRPDADFRPLLSSKWSAVMLREHRANQ